MKLRERFVLTLAVIALLLVAPAVYGLFALRELRQVAQDLSLRDAVGALALGRLQAAFSEVESAERSYLALANQPGPEREQIRTAVTNGSARVEAEFRRLSERGYREPTLQARRAWDALRTVIAQEQRLVESGNTAAADRYRSEVVDPAFAAVDRSLDPIGATINQVGHEQVEHARTVARRAVTTTLLALAAALTLALAIGGWLARSLLLPIHKLRSAMLVVAEGDFEPELEIPQDRQDEIGDLTRSFRSMTEKLAELEKLRAQFVAVASHELKTPLSVIKGYVTLLQEGIYGDLPPEQQKVLASIGDQSERLGRLVQQLLDVSRFEAGGGRLDIRPFALRPFLAELVTSFEPLALQNDIDFKVEVADGLPETIHGDRDRLDEVIGNLLSNAFKFTPRNGQIRVSARNGSRRDDPYIVLEVRDTGIGIPEENLPRIFEKFYQVENEAQPLSIGSGLGLAIAREIAEAHGGTITAESQVGQGTTFRVFLPSDPLRGEEPRRPF